MTELRVGDVLENRYRVDHPIAQGGMSTVYRCIDLRLGRAVAVKVIDERLNRDAEFRNRFRSEARAMAKLSHPNLVNVYDFGSSGGNLFFVMELIDGGTLRELLAEKKTMPPYAVASILRALLQGLTVVHKAGMVHRDIKPDNVLITQDHQVKLSDFGLVRPRNQKRLTNEKIVGTVSYLSPEQVNGAPIGPESDVYSAGILAYEMLTGNTPFQGEDAMSRAIARTVTPVPAPSDTVPHIPHLVDEIIASATAMDPQQRFQNAEEFLLALNDVAETLDFPDYEIPAPRNAAASRAAAVPTEIEGVEDSTRIMNPRPPAPGDSTPTTHVQETRIITQEVPRPLPRRQPQRPPQHAPRRAPQRRTPPPRRPVRPVSNRSSWKMGIAVFLATLVIAGIAVAGWWVGSGRYGEVPQILGMDSTSATQALGTAGFTVAIEKTYSDSVPQDSVAESRPRVGKKAPKGSTVTLVISQGQPSVPEIPASRDFQDYKELLANYTLTAEEGEEVYSEDIDKGSIVDVDPQPGSLVATGSTVTVSLSKGIEMKTVPDVTGIDLDEARGRLEDEGFTIDTITKTFDSDVDKDKVISSEPTAGTEVEKGAPVSLTVSTAAKVPDVVGMDVEDAKTLLSEEGIKVREVRKDRSVNPESYDKYTVTSIDPPASTVIDSESEEVTLTIPGAFSGLRSLF